MAGNILQIRVGMYVIPVGTESVRSVLLNIMVLMAVDINAANVLGDVLNEERIVLSEYWIF